MPFEPQDIIAILALLVALVTPATTWLVARDRNAHEASLAREAREQTRRESLYTDVLVYAETVRDWVNRTHPFMTFAGEPGPPEFPSDDERRRLAARVSGLGSPAVQAALVELARRASAFQGRAWELDGEQKARNPSRPLVDVRRDVDAARQAIRDQVDELGRVVNEELAPKPPRRRALFRRA